MNLLINSLIDFIKSNYSPEEKSKTSKNGKTTTFYGKGGKSLCYIETDGKKSIVTLVIGAKLANKVNTAQLSDKAKYMFDKAKQYHDGKWLFFEVETQTDVDDIKTFLSFKRKLPL